jgi:hypothetical protein
MLKRLAEQAFMADVQDASKYAKLLATTPTYLAMVLVIMMQLINA